ncbi:MAG: undecaprenyl-diphosphate phosphatase [Clostridiales Family XIII bacterium]|jgi:undecaprenyl-diphosphatase|nr:undecaprenyl-diphosphate phosphatase [Clostridiales Family XIII bacterium]
MGVFESVVLGLAQGLSEFLPISSSGHLALLEHFFGIDENKVLMFAVLLHGGTLLSILAVYGKDVLKLLVELLDLIKDIFTGKGVRPNKNETRRLGLLILAATVPTAAVGLVLKSVFSSLYGSIMAIGVGLILTGTMMFLTERFRSGGKGVWEMKFSNALFVGLMQAVALCPGVSRSGSTIVGSLLSGLDRKFAVNFAFLISIPTVLGAFVLEAKDAFGEGLAGADAAPVALGMVVAAVSGFVAIKTMIRVVSDGKLYLFSIYTWAVGAAAFVYSLFL